MKTLYIAVNTSAVHSKRYLLLPLLFMLLYASACRKDVASANRESSSLLKQTVYHCDSMNELVYETYTYGDDDKLLSFVDTSVSSASPGYGKTILQYDDQQRLLSASWQSEQTGYGNSARSSVFGHDNLNRINRHSTIYSAYYMPEPDTTYGAFAYDEQNRLQADTEWFYHTSVKYLSIATFAYNANGDIEKELLEAYSVSGEDTTSKFYSSSAFTYDVHTNPYYHEDPYLYFIMGVQCLSKHNTILENYSAGDIRSYEYQYDDAGRPSQYSVSKNVGGYGNTTLSFRY